MTSLKLDTFIKTIIKYDTVNDILKQYDKQSMKGFIYERLWDLIIKFGFCSEFPKSKYFHMLGNVNSGKIEPMTSIQKYLKSNIVISGNSSGCSDITLLNNKTGEYIFISCKYPKSDEDKNVKYFDVQNIVAMCDDNKETYKKYKIYILVSNKKNVVKKINQSNPSSSYITKHMKNILDIDDLNKMFMIMMKSIVIKKINY
jgi:hypothetical protein